MSATDDVMAWPLPYGKGMLPLNRAVRSQPTNRAAIPTKPAPSITILTAHGGGLGFMLDTPSWGRRTHPMHMATNDL